MSDKTMSENEIMNILGSVDVTQLAMIVDASATLLAQRQSDTVVHVLQSLTELEFEQGDTFVRRPPSKEQFTIQVTSATSNEALDVLMASLEVMEAGGVKYDVRMHSHGKKGDTGVQLTIYIKHPCFEILYDNINDGSPVKLKYALECIQEQFTLNAPLELKEEDAKATGTD